ncbi:Putative ribonuclease H protein At1g65750 [Linum perenne]
MGIAATLDLGRYLGVPILHGKVTKHTYDFLLDRLDSRLAGWKTDNLSLAGRVTLASSVLNSLPSYVMQIAFLPVTLCDKIDRKIRDFVWGSSDSVRKTHNVNWDTVCKPKRMGGLGLRSARELNLAFLMKVAWGIISKPGELWARTLTSKYLIRNGIGFTLKRKTGFSSLWRGVMKVWNYTLQGLQWSIKNGRGTSFWNDKWLDSGMVLRDFAVNDQGVDLLASVSNFVLPDGNWNVELLSNCLPHGALVQVIGMSPPCEKLGDDEVAWGLEANGGFGVKSAYTLVKELDRSSEDNVWKKVWTWEGPAKIKQFMWLVTHGRLMTNKERRRRHIAPNANCRNVRSLVRAWSMFCGSVIWPSLFGRKCYRRRLAHRRISASWIGGWKVLPIASLACCSGLLLGFCGGRGTDWFFIMKNCRCQSYAVRLSSGSSSIRRAGRPFK